jgi:ABC-type transport system involved in Fe-S cluster assembly fused permease/ATPase subunit
VALTTVSAYTLFTVLITQWRTRFRKDMVRLFSFFAMFYIISLSGFRSGH